jgi:hypothetical protein
MTASNTSSRIIYLRSNLSYFLRLRRKATFESITSTFCSAIIHELGGLGGVW